MNDGTISEKDMIQLQVLSRSQTSLGNFFGTKRKSNTATIEASDVGNNSTLATAAFNKKAKAQTCVGVISWKCSEHKNAVGLFAEYAALHSKARYKFGFYSEKPQIFAKACDGTGGVKRGKQHGNGHVCNDCFSVRLSSDRKIRQIIRDRAATFERYLELMIKDELSPTDAKFLSGFAKCSDESLSDKGVNLRKRVKLTLKYYDEAEKALKNKDVKGKPKFIHGADKFLSEFSALYRNNQEFRNGLLCCLLHSFVAKLSGNPNPQLASSALNFSLALASSKSKKA